MYPVLFEFHGFHLTSFGVMLVIGVLAGGQLAALSMERLGRTRDEAWSLISAAVIGGVLGAKLWYVGETLARDPGVPLVPLLLSLGGLTWYGGLVGGIVAVLAYAKHRRIPLLAASEAAAPAVAMGHFFGRIGCFLVGDDWGRPTDLPWGIAFPNGIDPTAVPVHPTMLYEVAWLGVVTPWLWWRRGRSPFLFGEYLVLGGAGRFVIEFWRRNPALLGEFSNAQVTALVCMMMGALLWMGFRRRQALL